MLSTDTSSLCWQYQRPVSIQVPFRTKYLGALIFTAQINRMEVRIHEKKQAS